MTKAPRNRAQKPSSDTLYKLTAAAIGLSLTGIDSWMNLEYVWQAEQAITSQVAAVPLASIAAAASLPFMSWAWSQRKYFDALGFAVMALLLAMFSFNASLARVGESRQKVMDQKQAINLKHELLAGSIKRLKGIRTVSQVELVKECKTVGPQCRIKRKDMVLADELISGLEARLVKTPKITVMDSKAKRVADILSDITGRKVKATTIQTYDPLVLPLGLQLGGLLFMGMAFGSKKQASPASRIKTAESVKPRDLIELLNLRKDKNGQVFIVQKNVATDLEWSAPKVSRELSNLAGKGKIAAKISKTIDRQRGTLVTLA